MPDTPLKIPGKLPKDALKSRSKGGARKGTGTREFTPTDEQRDRVKLHIWTGTPREQIHLHIINPATKKPISQRTFYRHFREEIQTAADEYNARLAESASLQALNGDGNLALRILEKRGGPLWNPSVSMNISGEITHKHEHLDRSQRIHLLRSLFDQGGSGGEVIDVDAETVGDAGRLASERGKGARVVALGAANRNAKTGTGK